MRPTSVLVIAALGLILTGCSVEAGPARSRPTAPLSSSATTADPSPAALKVVINCNLVLSDAHAAALSPSVRPIPTFAPAAGTLGAKMVEQGGRPCGWGAESTASLEVVVAIPTAAGLAAAKMSAASTGQIANAAHASAAYFEVAGGWGRAQIFMGSYWIEVASPAFTTPEQAEGVYSSVIADVRSAGG
ncbi:MAG TPA: hypothetical protein VFQ74_00040 [Pseudolysinimonas sp.]|nr:hypothetical protein [Pseudolysinimonas sp.]